MCLFFSRSDNERNIHLRPRDTNDLFFFLFGFIHEEDQMCEAPPSSLSSRHTVRQFYVIYAYWVQI